MCGIAGILTPQNEIINLKELNNMTDALVHRGPDASGIFSNPGIGLGHRRLKILDLTDNASQPMTSKTGRFTITYNGEIYNYKELRKELELKGYNFSSSGDTEVLLAAFDCWHTDCLSKLNGMFAFAIWDSVNQKLTIARDRYGIKPVYLFKTSQAVYFASEQKAFKSLTQFDKHAINFSAINEYLTFQNILSFETFHEKIELVEPGTYLEIFYRRRELCVHKYKYWSFCFQEPFEKVSVREYEEELSRLIDLSVSKQLVSDVEVGSFLSGGIDSGIIVALASKYKPLLKTFTCGFNIRSSDGLSIFIDEREIAKERANQFSTEHFEIALNSKDFENCFSDLNYHLDEPRVGQSYPNYYINKLASKHVSVVFSGAGGDELFGGYPWRYLPEQTQIDCNSFHDQYFNYWNRLLSETQRAKLINTKNFNFDFHKPRKIYNQYFDIKNKYYNNIDILNECLNFEAKTFLHGILHVEDKISMAHSLETRLPFLDNLVVDFAMQCPAGLKVSYPNNYQNKSPQYRSDVINKSGKKILRRLSEKLLTPTAAQALKKGFGAPDGRWFAKESLPFVKHKLLNKNNNLYEFLNYKSVHKILDEHTAGNENRLLIWSLISVNEWFTQNT